VRDHIAVNHANFHCDIVGNHIGYNVSNYIADEQPDDFADLQRNNIAEFVGDVNAEFHRDKHCHNRDVHRLKHRLIVSDFNCLLDRDILGDVFCNDFSVIIRHDIANVLGDLVRNNFAVVFRNDFSVIICHFEFHNNRFVVCHNIGDVDCNHAIVWEDQMR